ncbi:MAG: DUF1329 domain-containing protein [Gammaproteobacteria bacterium]|nr:DUF1329 domain-containing protein [Gammaproteobacteria bacterium]
MEGKVEVYVPYNAYKLHADELKVSDIITKQGRLNQDLVRYELHRVWKLKGTLKEGTTHDYGVRMMYLDEDSWWFMLGDMYDRRNQLWRLHSPPHHVLRSGLWTQRSRTSTTCRRGAWSSLASITRITAPDFSFRSCGRLLHTGEIRRRGAC